MNEIPTLTQHLKAQYDKFFANLPPIARPSYVGINGYLAFCEKYLGEINPAVEMYYPGNNLGLILADRTIVTLAETPESQATGQMEESSAVPVTTGDLEASRVVKTKSVRV